MTDLIPWLDETYIVEMGRLFLCGGDADSILLGRGQSALLPLCYVAPLAHELAFRLCGQVGVRLLPFFALGAAALAFHSWLRRSRRLPRQECALLALSVAFSPLLYQSALLTRADCLALFFLFASWRFLATGLARDSVRDFALAGALAALSALTWPTAFLFGATHLVLLAESRRWRPALFFSAAALAALAALMIPAIGALPAVLHSFARHYSEVTSPAGGFLDVAIPLAKEISRSPFLASLSLVGLATWARRRKWTALTAFAIAFATASLAGLYTFRIVYLVPFFCLASVEAAEACRDRFPRLLRNFLWLTVAYGVLTGPVGHLVLDYPRLPPNVKAFLAETVGTGPIRVFAPDHAAYYVGRELGWRQRGFARPSDMEDREALARVLDGCEAAVLRDFDPYATFQQSCTPYGLFSKYVLRRAREEKDLPAERKSPLARFGSRFSFAWHAPVELDGFREVARDGMIRVFRRASSGDGSRSGKKSD